MAAGDAPAKDKDDHADEVHAEEAHPPEPEIQHSPTLLPPGGLGKVLGPYLESDFVELRRAITSQFRSERSVATEDDPSRVTRAEAELQLAHLYLAHLMVPEARSALATVERNGLPGRMQDRHRLLETAAVVFAGDKERYDALKAERPDWHAACPDCMFFDALERIDARKYSQSVQMLQTAWQLSKGYPKPIKQMAMPQLLLAAVETGQWELAREIAEVMSHDPDLAHSEEFAYLKGRAAMLGGNLEAAVEAFTEAEAGSGKFAQLARLGRVETQLRLGEMTLDMASRRLKVVDRLWRGDEIELATLKLMSKVDEARHDTVSALEHKGRILMSFSGRAENAEIALEAADLIESFYHEGMEGEIPLAQFVAGHRRIETYYRFFEPYLAASEKLADHLSSIGATTLAAREYALLHDYLAVSDELGLRMVTEEELDELVLKRSHAQISAGRFDQAAALLAPGPESRSAKIRKSWREMQAELLARTGEVQALAEFPDPPDSANFLRRVAEARFSLDQWQLANVAYGKLFDSYRPEFTFTDAAYALLAAFRTEDRDRVAALAEAFPELTKIPQWSEVAAGMVDVEPAVLPLRKARSEELIGSAANTLDNLTAIETAHLEKAEMADKAESEESQ